MSKQDSGTMVPTSMTTSGCQMGTSSTQRLIREANRRGLDLRLGSDPRVNEKSDPGKGRSKESQPKDKGQHNDTAK